MSRTHTIPSSFDVKSAKEEGVFDQEAYQTALSQMRDLQESGGVSSSKVDSLADDILAVTRDPGKKPAKGHHKVNIGNAADIGAVTARHGVPLVEVADDENANGEVYAVMHTWNVGNGEVPVVYVLGADRDEFEQRLKTARATFYAAATKLDGAAPIVADGGTLVEREVVPEKWSHEGSRWLLWQYRDDRKIPRNPRLGRGEQGWTLAGAKDPEAWMEYDEALRWTNHDDDLGLAYYLAKPGYGTYPDEEKGYDYQPEELPDEEHVGLVDLDDVRDPDTGEAHPIVEQLIDATDHTFWEVSPSGTGFHIYGNFTVPEDQKTKGLDISTDEYPNAEIEVYDGGRYTTVTGKHLAQTSTEFGDIQDTIDSLLDEFGERKEVGGEDAEGHVPDVEKDEVLDIEKTGDIETVFSAIKHTDYSDIRLRSTLTEGENASRKSFDPTWATSKSGTRLGYENGGWIYRDGGIGLDALQVVALEEGIITDETDYPSGEDFWDAVEELRRRGAHIPEYDPNEQSAGSFTPAIPKQAVEYFGSEELRRHATKKGVEWPSVEEVRDRNEQALERAFRDGASRVINAPTGSGKTHSVSSQKWLDKPEVTDEDPVVVFHKTREARDQAAEMSEDNNVLSKTLKGRKETCPVAAGHQDPGNDHGNPAITIDGKPVSEWIDYMTDVLGYPYSFVHTIVEERAGVTPVCEEGDTQCQSKSMFDDVPRDGDGNTTHDVVHATVPFAHVPSLRMHTHMVFDEKPDFSMDTNGDRSFREVFRDSVNAYLDFLGIPIDTYTELVNAAQRGIAPGRQRSLDGQTEVAKPLDDAEVSARFARLANPDVLLDTLDWQTLINYVDGKENDADDYDADDIELKVGEASDYQLSQAVDTEELIDNALRQSPPIGWFKSRLDVHANANAFARAVWEAEEYADGYYSARVSHEPPRLDGTAYDADAWNRETVSIVFNDDMNPVQARSVPDTTLASSVVGLDALAQENDPHWQANVMPGIETEFVLDTEERVRYRRYERQLHVVQVGDATHPVAGGQYLDKGQGRSFKAMVNHLHNRYGDEFRSAISSLAAEEKIREWMEDAGIEDPQTMHYGAEESRNDFEGERVGYVAGSIDPGDEPIIHTIAELQLDASPVRHECEECGGDGCETCDFTGVHREHGRTFEGKDAEAAERVLKGIREHHTQQSAGRLARHADDEDDRAVVYVQTDAIPDEMVDAKVPGPVWTATDTQEEVLEYVAEAEESVTVQEVADAVGISDEGARKTLKKVEERGGVQKHPYGGRYGAHLWEPTPTINTSGDVELDGHDFTFSTSAFEDTITYSLRMKSNLTVGGLLEGEDGAGEVTQLPLHLAGVLDRGGG